MGAERVQGYKGYRFFTQESRAKIRGLTQLLRYFLCKIREKSNNNGGPFFFVRSNLSVAEREKKKGAVMIVVLTH